MPNQAPQFHIDEPLSLRTLMEIREGTEPTIIGSILEYARPGDDAINHMEVSLEIFFLFPPRNKGKDYEITGRLHIEDRTVQITGELINHSLKIIHERPSSNRE